VVPLLGGDEEGENLSRKKRKKKEELEQAPADTPITFPSMNVDQGRI
jgi:hypothetical protein